jgi:hypothetical protein
VRLSTLPLSCLLPTHAHALPTHRQLRSTEEIGCIAHVERAVGAAVSAMGIESFIGLVELDLASDEPKPTFATGE